MKTYSDLRKVVGKPKTLIDMDQYSTVEDLIAVLVEKFEEKFRCEVGSSLKEGFNQNFNVYLKGRLIYPSEYSQTKLEEQDEVTIMRPIGGG